MSPRLGRFEVRANRTVETFGWVRGTLTQWFTTGRNIQIWHLAGRRVWSGLGRPWRYDPARLILVRTVGDVFSVIADEIRIARSASDRLYLASLADQLDRWPETEAEVIDKLRRYSAWQGHGTVKPAPAKVSE